MSPAGVPGGEEATVAPQVGPWVAAALRDLGTGLDGRGLLPLEEARRRVAAVEVFARGRSHKIEGQPFRPTDGDYLWASLLSLRDADEFVGEASRLTWRFSPRGADNIAPVERYGDGVLPWIASLVGGAGELPASPSCLRPCLMSLGSKAALTVLLGVRDPRGSDPDGLGLLSDWLDRHGDDGLRSLAALAEAGQPAAARAVDRLSRRAPRRFRRRLARAAGVSEAESPVASSTDGLGEDAILRILDAAATRPDGEDLSWPALTASVGHFECHALRLVSARDRGGDDWGLLIEVVQGDVASVEARWPATIQQYRYGSRVRSGGRYLQDCRPLGLSLRLRDELPPFAVPRHLEGIVVTAPSVGTFELSDELSERLDLRAGRSSSGRVESWPAVLAIRAVLAMDPGAFWSSPEEEARSLGLRDPVVIAATDRFEHVEGPERGRGKRRRLPSESPVFCSLAAAIARLDPERFEPGRTNTSWRLHARKKS